jgi:hypothetical protein
MEREKFQQLQEAKFSEIGKAVFTHGITTIYKVN